MNNDNDNMNNDSINNINSKPPIEIIQNHPCYRHRTKNVEFSSTYIPPSTGLQSSCEIPFGYIITPFSIASTEDISTINYDMNTEEDQPITCVSCLGYFNIYCEVMNQGSIWICPLCNYHNAIPINSYNLLGSCMSSPLLEYRTKINQVKHKYLKYIIYLYLCFFLTFFVLTFLLPTESKYYRIYINNRWKFIKFRNKKYKRYIL